MKTIFGDTIWWAVYGVFKKDECLYVGSTRNAYSREFDHQRRFGKRTVMTIFHWTKSKDRASKLECKYIRKYKALKQARFNKNGCGQRKPKARVWIVYASKSGDLSCAPFKDYKEITVQELL